MSLSNVAETTYEETGQKIKCVVWDLDHTIWDGILIEDRRVTLKKNIRNIIEALDQRGILQSIASRNNLSQAMEKLKEFKLDHYFLYPQIGWDSKSVSVREIARQINIGLDTVAFVDDQGFERDEVRHHNPEVMCIDALAYESILEMPEMNPRFITDESAIRRKMYQADIRRNENEESFEGSKNDFLISLNMEFTISPATEEDLKRAEELTQRTHQLNTTGYTYSYDELDKFRTSDNHLLYVASLTDKYGVYGKIGLALIEKQTRAWRIKLLLMSCRVMSRGVGSILIRHLINEANRNGVKLLAEWVPTDVNRMMYATYKFEGFEEIESDDEIQLLECTKREHIDLPDHLKIVIEKC